MFLVMLILTILLVFIIIMLLVLREIGKAEEEFYEYQREYEID